MSKFAQPSQASFEANECLVIVEQKQKEMTRHISDLTKAITANTQITTQIKEQLDELSGAKKVLFGLTGLVVAALTVVASWVGTHHK